MNFYELMRMANKTGEAVLLPDNVHLRRPMSSTTDRSSKSTGTSIIGFFEMFRDKDGRRVFIGQDGQYRRM